jgi:hypothetical protein
MLQFAKLNIGWDADPNVPEPEWSSVEKMLVLRFWLNRWTMNLEAREQATLTFADPRRWRLGDTNDEGWYRGQCRYSCVAPAWGEFYEIIGTDDRGREPLDWITHDGAGTRHFLFYFRDEAFECFASDWRYNRASVGLALFVRRE